MVKKKSFFTTSWRINKIRLKWVKKRIMLENFPKQKVTSIVVVFEMLPNCKENYLPQHQQRWSNFRIIKCTFVKRNFFFSPKICFYSIVLYIAHRYILPDGMSGGTISNWKIFFAVSNWKIPSWCMLHANLNINVLTIK